MRKWTNEQERSSARDGCFTSNGADSDHARVAQLPANVRVVSVTAVGNRVRVGLAAPQPVTAELSDASAHALDLRSEASVIATWEAAATRLLRI